MCPFFVGIWCLRYMERRHLHCALTDYDIALRARPGARSCFDPLELPKLNDAVKGSKALFSCKGVIMSV